MNKRTVLSSLFAGIIVMSMAFVGCSKKDDDSSTGATSSDLTISGSLATASLMSTKRDFSSFAVNLSDLEIYAIAFTSPPVISEADVNSDGSFSVSLPGAKGSSVTAVFRDKTTANEVGVVTFVDSSKKDMSGNAKESSSIVLSDSVNLGNLVLGDDGSVKVNVSDIQTVVAAPATVATAFDMTGSWIASAYENPPTGYKTTCAEGTPENDCDGPSHGMQIDLLRFAGKEFTPNDGACDIDQTNVTCDATTDGTVSDTDRYALGVWEGGGPEACGFKTGFSEAEARAGGFIHLTSSGLPTIGGTQLTFGDMDGYDPYFWVKTAATAPTGRDFYDCIGTSVTIGEKPVPAYACKGNILNNSNQSDTGSDGWMVNLANGGCFDSTGKPVRVNNWNIAPITDSCSNSTTGLPDGFSRGTCSYTGDPDGSGSNYTTDITYTCSWVSGQFADSSGAPNFSSPVASDKHVGPPAIVIGGGVSCGVTDSTKPTSLAKAQCAAQHYENNRNSISATCAPRPRFNWGANTVDNFYHFDYRPKPDSQFIMDVLSYDATGALATVDTEERESFTVPVDDGTVTCEIARKIVFNTKKTGDNTAVVEIRFSGRMASTAAVCQSLAKVALENAAYNQTVTDQNQRRRAVDNADLEYTLLPQAMIFNLTRQ